ncbi:hypothetical protein [Stenotrophomonas maltophilia]|uniref:hypothetical protein n=1 Tax=Stenotrophomonas maltophilia TaxID=40324 RepID=UPI0025F9E7FA|nr:hypothetical protein [uncultured Stenotrophomonas sp.]
MPEQLTPANVLRVVMALACGAILVCLVRAIAEMECPVLRFSPTVPGSLFLSLAMLLIYVKFKILTRGVLQTSLRLVRISFLSVAAIELMAIGIVVGFHGECESVIRTIPIPAALMIFYTGSIFALVFGDGYLGVLRRVIRLGAKPVDFMNDRALGHKR